MRPANRQESGFTLVEMAVVIVIVGILLTGLGGIAKSWLRLANIKQTKLQLQTVVNTVMALTAANNALPDKTKLSAALQTDQLTDAWGQPIRYAFNGGLGNLKGYRSSGDPSTLTTICSLTSLDSDMPPTSINAQWTIKDCQAGQSSCQDVTNVAFVVMSAGENRSRQVFATFGDSTAKQATPIATETLPARGAATPAVSGENGLPSSDTGFDDLIASVTLSQLQAQLGCAARNAADQLTQAGSGSGSGSGTSCVCKNPGGNGSKPPDASGSCSSYGNGSNWTLSCS